MFNIFLKDDKKKSAVGESLLYRENALGIWELIKYFVLSIGV